MVFAVFYLDAFLGDFPLHDILAEKRRPFLREAALVCSASYARHWTPLHHLLSGTTPFPFQIRRYRNVLLLFLSLAAGDEMDG